MKTWKYPWLAMSIGAGLLLGAGACDSTDTQQQVEPHPYVASQTDQDQDTTAPSYNHPLKDSAFEFGGVPFQEVKDAPDGGRIALVQGESVDENGEITTINTLVTLEHEPIDSKELDKLVQEGKRGYDQSPTAPVLSSVLESRLATMGPQDTEEVIISVRKPSTYQPLTQRKEAAIAWGEVQTWEDRARVRSELVDELHEDVVRAVEPVRAYITETLKGEVTFVGTHSFTMQARLSAWQIRELSRFPDVVRVDPLGHIKENTTYYIDGRAISRGLQMTTESSSTKQFLDDGYTGQKAYTGGIHVGVLEHKRLREEHPGFKGADSYVRISLKRVCDRSGCHIPINYDYNPPIENDFSTPDSTHSTIVSGILMGDLTQDQDPSVTDKEEQKARSGYAREAVLDFWQAVDDPYIASALNDIAAHPPQVLNISIEYGGEDTQCKGEDSVSRALNNAYEAGVAIFYAAGNDGFRDGPTNTSPVNYTDCRIDSPGSAMGAFVVGGTYPQYYSYTTLEDAEQAVRTAPMFDQNYPCGINHNCGTSRGGTNQEGKHRTIIDIVSPAKRYYWFDGVSTIPGYGSSYASGTSFSAPTVAAAAAILMDFYADKYDNWLEDPGRLYAHLLVMGDGEKSGHSDQPEGTSFDNLWGAGRLKMRRWDTYGLDYPYGWTSYSTCIDDGEDYYYYLNSGNALSSYVDVIKTALFFYDHRHEDGVQIDDIDIYLQRYDSVTGNWITVASSTGYEEKERIIYHSVNQGSRKYRLKIRGVNVTSDDAGCGTNSMKVYFMLYYEDLDRDDYDGPDDDVEAQ